MTTGDLANYRRISSCANCMHCEDIGVDEEVLICELFGPSRSHRDDIHVEHDGFCDAYFIANQ